jgi:adenylate cyclase
MVGRDKDLAALRTAVGDLMTGNAGWLILVTGEAGIGKSRLIAEAKAGFASEPVAVLEGACQAHTATMVYSLFASLLENYLRLPAAGAQARRSALDAWLIERIPSQASTVGLFIAHLLDLPITDDEAAALLYLEPSQLQQQVFVAVRDLLLSEASQQATVVILEDLHWIDSASLELLVFLAPMIEQVPLILCGISRPLSGQAVPRLKDLGMTRLANRFLLVELNPLSVDDTDALLEDLLAIPAFSDALRQAILDEAGGNPFFLEEFVRMLIDEGYIAMEEGKEKGQWVALRDIDLERLRVPQTLQELIVTRVDRLPMGPRHVLACATVLGQNFNVVLLREVVNSEHRPALDTHLQYLHAYDFVSPRAQVAGVCGVSITGAPARAWKAYTRISWMSIWSNWPITIAAAAWRPRLCPISLGPRSGTHVVMPTMKPCSILTRLWPRFLPCRQPASQILLSKSRWGGVTFICWWVAMLMPEQSTGAVWGSCTVAISISRPVRRHWP